jgi:hypothetical protein
MTNSGMKKILLTILLFSGNYTFAQQIINEYTCYRKELDNKGFHKDLKLGQRINLFHRDSLSPEQGCEIPFGINPKVQCYTLLSYSEEKYKVGEDAPYKIGLYFFNDSLIMIEMEFQGIEAVYSYADLYEAEDCIEKRTDYNEKTVEAAFSVQGDSIYLNTNFKKLGINDATGFTTIQLFNKKIMKRIAKPARKPGDY